MEQGYGPECGFWVWIRMWIREGVRIEGIDRKYGSGVRAAMWIQALGRSIQMRPQGKTYAKEPAPSHAPQTFNLSCREVMDTWVFDGLSTGMADRRMLMQQNLDGNWKRETIICLKYRSNKFDCICAFYRHPDVLFAAVPILPNRPGNESNLKSHRLIWNEHKYVKPVDIWHEIWPGSDCNISNPKTSENDWKTKTILQLGSSLPSPVVSLPKWSSPSLFSTYSENHAA